MTTTTVADADAASPAITHPGAGFRRVTAALALVSAPALIAVSSVLQPDLDGTEAELLEAMAGTGPAISGVTFLLAQLPMLVAALAIGHLLRARSRRLAAWGTTLAFVGAFGHTVFGGMSLVWMSMANDGTSRRGEYAHLMHEVMTSPVMVFAMVGLVGTVLGLLLLSIALFRAHVGPRWVGPMLWLFLIVEFVGTSLSQWAIYASTLCLAAAFLALAAHVARQPLESY